MGQKKYKFGFDYNEHPSEIDKPLHWKKPRRIFVNSMSDLFYETATDGFISAIFNTMMIANHHTYQILTKRPERMRDFILQWLKTKNLQKVPNHIWLGTSIENQDYIWRMNFLKEIPGIRFISFEPLLGPIEADLTNIHWAIVGGESGFGHRKIKSDWIEHIQLLCKNSGTAFFFKQWGGIYPTSNGRKLNGKIYSEYPELAAA